MTKKITAGEWSTMISDVVTNRYISELTFRNMSLDFIGKVLDENVHGVPFDSLLAKISSNEYLRIDAQYYSSEEIFFREFSRKKLDIEIEPSKKYFHIRRDVDNRIKEIKKRIAGITQLKEESSGKVQSLANIENYTSCHPLLSFFLDKNIKAIEFFKEYLVDMIVPAAIRSSRVNHLKFIVSSLEGFEFLRYENRFLNLDARFILSHRYGELPAPDAEVVFSAYDDFLHLKNDNYRSFPHEYIKEIMIEKRIADKCKTHHILYERKYLILKSLEMYKKKDFLSLVVLIPSVIEGLLNDVCLMYGKCIDDIYKHGFVIKMGIIESENSRDAENNYISSLEYFRYFFPTMRNQISHGWYNGLNNIDVLGGHLILDLYAACEIVTIANYKLNTYIGNIIALYSTKIKYMSYDDVKKFLEQVLAEFNWNNYNNIYNIYYRRDVVLERFFSKKMAKKIINAGDSDEIKVETIIRLLSEISRNAKRKNLLDYQNTADTLKTKLVNRYRGHLKQRKLKLDLISKLLNRSSTA